MSEEKTQSGQKSIEELLEESVRNRKELEILKITKQEGPDVWPDPKEDGIKKEDRKIIGG